MLTYTLVADGSSDACLMPIVDWLISSRFPDIAFSGVLAAGLPAARHGLHARLSEATRLFPCDILLVHRDAESGPADMRSSEIAEAMQGIENRHVPIVPVRMTEAWLLISQEAIRRASGNPNGAAPLQLPQLNRIEHQPDPKAILLRALSVASDVGARRRAGLDLHAMRRRVAEYINDFSALRQFQTFVTFEAQLNAAIEAVEGRVEP